jgi:hypothetical protein
MSGATVCFTVVGNNAERVLNELGGLIAVTAIDGLF